MFQAKSTSLPEKLSFLVLAALVAFPVIDYILRNVLPVPVLSTVWDDLLLLAGLALVGLRLLGDGPGGLPGGGPLSRLLGSGPLGRLGKVPPPGKLGTVPPGGTGLTKPILALLLVGLAYLTLDLTSLAVNIEGFRVVFQFMLVFFVAYYLTGRPEKVRTLLALAVITGTLMACYGIYQYIQKVPMPGNWADTTETLRTRVFSITTSSNALGSQMAMLIPIALGLLVNEKTWPKKLFWLGAAGAMGACLIFTFSRGAWLALAGAIIIIGILADRRILIIGIVAAVLAVLVVPEVSHRITYLLSPEYLAKSAQSGRLNRWLAAYDQMRNNPLFGAGLGHFGGAVAKRHYNIAYTDSYYLKTMAEMGLLGLTLFLGLILKTLREGYRAVQNLSPGLKYTALGMFGGLLAVVLHNAVENIFEIPYLNTYFWLVAGLLLALPGRAAEREGGSDG